MTIKEKGAMLMMGNNFLAGYTRCDYIQNTEGAYIDSGFICENNPGVLLDVTPTTYQNDLVHFITTATGSTTNFVVMHSRYHPIRIRYGSAYHNFDGARTAVNRRSRINVINGNVYDDNTKLGTLPGYVKGDNRHELVFGGGIGKIYSCELTENTISVRKFIPYIRDADREPGFIDLLGSICPITGTSFYVNAGSGRLIAGYD